MRVLFQVFLFAYVAYGLDAEEFQSINPRRSAGDPMYPIVEFELDRWGNIWTVAGTPLQGLGGLPLTLCSPNLWVCSQYEDETYRYNLSASKTGKDLGYSACTSEPYCSNCYTSELISDVVTLDDVIMPGYHFDLIDCHKDRIKGLNGQLGLNPMLTEFPLSESLVDQLYSEGIIHQRMVGFYEREFLVLGDVDESKIKTKWVTLKWFSFGSSKYPTISGIDGSWSIENGEFQADGVPILVDPTRPTAINLKLAKTAIDTITVGIGAACSVDYCPTDPSHKMIVCDTKSKPLPDIKHPVLYFQIKGEQGTYPGKFQIYIDHLYFTMEQTGDTYRYCFNDYDYYDDDTLRFRINNLVLNYDKNEMGIWTNVFIPNSPNSDLPDLTEI